MKRVILNMLSAFILMLIQSNVDSAFGIQMMAQFGVIAAVLSAMTAMPLASSAVAMLALALLCDIFVSGPIGLYSFGLMLVFGISHAVVARFRSERLIAVMIFAAIFTGLFELLLATMYSAFYRDTVFFTICAHVAWKDILLTTIFVPLVMWINSMLETLFTHHKKRALS